MSKRRMEGRKEGRKEKRVVLYCIVLYCTGCYIRTMVVLSREELREVTARVCPVITLTPASHR